jgi:uncharacterized protein YodC (DUF2158 family)
MPRIEPVGLVELASLDRLSRQPGENLICISSSLARRVVGEIVDLRLTAQQAKRGLLGVPVWLDAVLDRAAKVQPTRTPKDGDRLGSFTVAELGALPPGAKFERAEDSALIKGADGMWARAGSGRQWMAADILTAGFDGSRILVLPKPAAEASITPGSVVCLRSGGPAMTVDFIEDGRAACAYFVSDYDLERLSLPLDAVVLAEGHEQPARSAS